MATSQNGWPVNPARTYRQVPGSTVRITVADGVAGDVLMYVASQFDQRVEDVDWRSTRGEFDDWGWADRPIRGSNQTSNHASATAIDLNATRHPLGVRGTFTAAQVAEIRKILAEVDHVVRWGGDYTGRADEMHFEINANYGRVKAVADRLKGGGGGAAPGQEEDDMFAVIEFPAAPNGVSEPVPVDPRYAHRLIIAPNDAPVNVRAIWNWGDVHGTGGNPGRENVHVKEGEAFEIPKGTMKADFAYDSKQAFRGLLVRA